MSEWHNESWIQSPLLIPAIWGILLTCLAAAVAWFIDGVRRYGYWLHKGGKDGERGD